MPSRTSVREWPQYVAFLILYSVLASPLGDQKMVKTAPQGSPGKQVCTYLKCATKSLCHGTSFSKKEGGACVRNLELKWFLGGGLF